MVNEDVMGGGPKHSVYDTKPILTHTDGKNELLTDVTGGSICAVTSIQCL